MMATWLSSIVEDLRFEVGLQPRVAHDREATLVDFVLTPLYAERAMGFGSLLCLDAFLQTITIVPLRALRQVYRRRRIHGADGDLYQFIIMGIVYRVLQTVNTSRVYHSIRGQAGITMFVMYSLVSVFDKFLCTVGHEVSECLASPRTAASRRRALVYSGAAFMYTLVHSFILMWQLVTVNLAVNSYSNALLSFMLTQQIGEIKSAVFKRAKRNALFQITCADITQRFQLGSILLVIVLRNILELWWNKILTLQTASSVCGPSVLLMTSGVLVDWMKCAYMTSFNNIQPRALYTAFYEDLKADYAVNYYKGAQNLLSKQAGLPVAPLAIVCVRMFAKGGVLYHPITPVMFVLLLFTKLRLGHWLRKITGAHELIRASMQKEENAQREAIAHGQAGATKEAAEQSGAATLKGAAKLKHVAEQSIENTGATRPKEAPTPEEAPGQKLRTGQKEGSQHVYSNQHDSTMWPRNKSKSAVPVETVPVGIGRLINIKRRDSAVAQSRGVTQPVMLFRESIDTPDKRGRSRSPNAKTNLGPPAE